MAYSGEKYATEKPDYAALRTIKDQTKPNITAHKLLFRNQIPHSQSLRTSLMLFPAIRTHPEISLQRFDCLNADTQKQDDSPTK